MAFTKAIVFFNLSLLLLSCLTVSADVADSDLVSPSQAPSHSPAESPRHHHHHHHHHQNKAQSPSQSPVQAPSQHPPKVKAPSHSPVQAPSQQPPKVKAPSHAPVQSPSQQPPKAKSPSHAPVQAPSQAPSYPLPKRRLVAVQGVVFCKSCNYSGVDTLMGATPLHGATVRMQCNNTKYPLVQEAKTDPNGYFFWMAPKTITTFGSHKCKVYLASSPAADCSKPTNLHSGQVGAILMPPKQQPPVTGSIPSFQIFSVGPFAFEHTKKC